nr:MAG TPA: hypothetical protein [Caudoviricetes sp.]
MSGFVKFSLAMRFAVFSEYPARIAACVAFKSIKYSSQNFFCLSVKPHHLALYFYCQAPPRFFSCMQYVFPFFPTKKDTPKSVFLDFNLQKEMFFIPFHDTSIAHMALCVNSFFEIHTRYCGKNFLKKYKKRLDICVHICYNSIIERR